MPSVGRRFHRIGHGEIISTGFHTILGDQPLRISSDKLPPTMKLGLGTVQFGLPYGIANASGQVPFEQVLAILREASTRGLRVLDTAIAYGSSETVLGAALRKLELYDFRVVSKIPSGVEAGQISALVRASLERLSIPKAHGYLFHDVETYRQDPRTLAELWKLHDEGLIQRVGFSVYEPREVERLLEEGVRFDIIQFPYSVFDRRFERLLDPLKRRGIEIHTRSVFLQGLFFLPPERLPPALASVRDAVAKLQELAATASLPVAALPLCFALEQSQIDVVLVGVDSLANLNQDLEMAQKMRAVLPLMPQLLELQQHDENILLPMRWKAI